MGATRRRRKTQLMGLSAGGDRQATVRNVLHMPCDRRVQAGIRLPRTLQQSLPSPHYAGLSITFCFLTQLIAQVKARLVDVMPKGLHSASSKSNPVGLPDTYQLHSLSRSAIWMALWLVRLWQPMQPHGSSATTGKMKPRWWAQCWSTTPVDLWGNLWHSCRTKLALSPSQMF